MRNVDKMLRGRHWIFAVTPFLNIKLTILSDSSTQSNSKTSQFQMIDVFPEISRKFKRQNHAMKLRMKNDIFHWCRYRVKID